MIALRHLPPAQPLPERLRDLTIKALRLDSRAVTPGDLFLAVPGHNADGRQFIDAAVRAGATVVVEEGDAFAVHPHDGAVRITVTALRRQVGVLAARYFGEPGRRLKVIGVTGTNGKTSITWFLRDALNALGHACGLIGTLGVGLKGQEDSTGHTTPDPITLQKALLDLCDAGADSVAMEVSSHALDQHRLGSTPVRIAVFSNLSRDHLDYHGDMDAYLLAKVALFTRPELQEAVINSDDAAAPVLLGRLNDGVRCITYGAQAGATVRCVAWQPHPDGMDLRLTVGGEAVNVTLPLFGAFNLSNVMAVAGALHGSGVEPRALADALAAITPVPGRMEPIREAGKPTVIVDYAHTPDGLEKALAAAREHFPGRLHCVVGCGGDRDTGKRPLMAAAAASKGPLAARNDVLSVVPGPLSVDALRRAIDQADCVAVIKLGRHFGKVRTLLAEMGLVGQARYVAHATMANQSTIPLADVDGDSVPYFSMILVHKRGAAWR